MSSFNNTERDLSKYSNINKFDRYTNTYLGIAIADKLTQKNGQDYKLIDAVDIDWNGIYVPEAETYIYHTEDLIDLLGEMININNFTEVSVRISNAEVTLREIIASYVSRTELGLALGNYQEKLKAGAYISILNNVISAYNVLSENDIYNTFSTRQELRDLSDDVHLNYYDKAGVKDFIDNTLIKNADPNFNDLEKISNWIKKQSKFTPVSNEYIENNPNETYYKYNSNTEEYVEVTIEEIHNNPDVTYYVLKDSLQNIDELIQKVNELDNTIGKDNGDGTYTGIIKDLHELENTDAVIFNNINNLYDQMTVVSESARASYSMAYNSYVYSELSYTLADTALSYTNEAITYSSLAYTYAMHVNEVIGREGIPSHFEELTEEDKEILRNNFDDFEYPIYIIDGDTKTRVYIYSDDNNYEYYKEIPYQDSTGFYNRIETVEKNTNRALYNLSYTNTYSSDYAYISITPATYVTPNRELQFTFKEGNVSAETGEIIQEGIVTTFVLKDSLTYLSKMDKVDGIHDDVEGLIPIDENP